MGHLQRTLAQEITTTAGIISLSIKEFSKDFQLCQYSGIQLVITAIHGVTKRQMASGRIAQFQSVQMEQVQAHPYPPALQALPNFKSELNA